MIDKSLLQLVVKVDRMISAKLMLLRLLEGLVTIKTLDDTALQFLSNKMML